MIQRSIIFSLFFLFFQAQAQQAEKVYSITKEYREVAWYELQQKLWKAEVDKNNKNVAAWENYYSATRALKLTAPYQISDEEKQKQVRDNYQKQGDLIVQEAAKAIPNSFEYYYIKYWNDGFKNEADLLKAYEINPNDERTYENLLVNYLLKNDAEKVSFFGKKLFEANHFPASMLNWGYNILAELDENAVLFTAGDNDSYSCWVVQEALGFRKDVQVINTSLILENDYRNQVWEKLEYPKNEFKISAEADKKRIFEHFFAGNRPVYVSSTAIRQFNSDWETELYLTGLAYKHCKSALDNASIIRRNYEKRYLLNYLTEQFSVHLADEVSKNLNATYLPSLIKLYQSYSESEDWSKQKEIEPLLLKLAEESNQQSEIIEVLGKSNVSSRFLSTVLDLKKLDKNMLLISGNLYANKYEVTNAEYRLFLANVLRSKQLDLYKNVCYDSSQWEKKIPADFNKPMMESYHSHPAYDEYPIVNITYEAANAYCDWLTQQYNLQRKREFTQVKFRLPTEEEWRLAAGSGNKTVKSPFPNDKIRNEKGCYLANIKPSDGRYMDDGLFFTGRVSNYNPNVLGLYGMVGNVAEMIAVNGKAKGGSWYTNFEESKFDQTQKYTGPDPGIGFRIFMEVIEK